MRAAANVGLARDPPTPAQPPLLAQEKKGVEENRKNITVTPATRNPNILKLSNGLVTIW